MIIRKLYKFSTRRQRVSDPDSIPTGRVFWACWHALPKRWQLRVILELPPHGGHDTRLRWALENATEL